MRQGVSRNRKMIASPQRAKRRSSSCSVFEKNILFFTKEPDIEKRLARLTCRKSIGANSKHHNRKPSRKFSQQWATLDREDRTVPKLAESKHNVEPLVKALQKNGVNAGNVVKKDNEVPLHSYEDNGAAASKVLVKRTSIKKVKPFNPQAEGENLKPRTVSEGASTRRYVRALPKGVAVGKSGLKKRQRGDQGRDFCKQGTSGQVMSYESAGQKCDKTGYYQRLQVLLMNHIRSVPSQSWSVNVDPMSPRRRSSTTLNTASGMKRLEWLPCEQLSSWNIGSARLVEQSRNAKQKTSTIKMVNDQKACQEKSVFRRLKRNESINGSKDRSSKIMTDSCRVKKMRKSNQGKDTKTMNFFRNNGFVNSETKLKDRRDWSDENESDISLLPCKDSFSLDSLNIGHSTSHDKQAITLTTGKINTFGLDSRQRCKDDSEEITCSSPYACCNPLKDVLDFAETYKKGQSGKHKNFIDSTSAKHGLPSKNSSATDIEDWSQMTSVCWFFDGKSGTAALHSGKTEKESEAENKLVESAKMAKTLLDSDQKDTSTWQTAQQDCDTFITSPQDDRGKTSNVKPKQPGLEKSFNKISTNQPDNGEVFKKWTNKVATETLQVYAKEKANESTVKNAAINAKDSDYSRKNAVQNTPSNRIDQCNIKETIMRKQVSSLKYIPINKTKSATQSKSDGHPLAGKDPPKNTLLHRGRSKTRMPNVDLSPGHQKFNKEAPGKCKVRGNVPSSYSPPARGNAQTSTSLMQPEFSGFLGSAEDLMGLNELIKGIVFQFSKFSPPRRSPKDGTVEHRSTVDATMLLQKAQTFQRATSFPIHPHVPDEPIYNSLSLLKLSPPDQNDRPSPKHSAITEAQGKAEEVLEAASGQKNSKNHKLKIRVSVKPSRASSNKIVVQEAEVTLPECRIESVNTFEEYETKVMSEVQNGVNKENNTVDSSISQFKSLHETIPKDGFNGSWQAERRKKVLAQPEMPAHSRLAPPPERPRNYRVGTVGSQSYSSQSQRDTHFIDLVESSTTLFKDVISAQTVTRPIPRPLPRTSRPSIGAHPPKPPKPAERPRQTVKKHVWVQLSEALGFVMRTAFLVLLFLFGLYMSLLMADSMAKNHQQKR